MPQGHDEEAAIISLNGIGAFHHDERSAFWQQMIDRKELQPLLLLVSSSLKLVQ